MPRIFLATFILISFTMNACLQSNAKKPSSISHATENWFVDQQSDTIYTIHKPEAQWKSELDAKSYHVLREKGTEMAFTGAYNDHKKSGIYHCKACGLSLFSSTSKFESGTGWPSFYKPVDKTHVLEESDISFGMRRVEVLCHRCGGHLGHVFDDGPEPTGLRYCMNSAALEFKAQ